ncbi:MAG: hypothetical protein HEP71_32880 [Roseivirga sp.]|nr:hypothetical protein [Roseivirga sp.]
MNTKRQPYHLIFYVLCIVVLSHSLVSCKKDDPDPEEEKLKELAASWRIDSVTNDNQDVTSQYTGFVLSVEGTKTYSTVNGGNPWPVQGTFDFVNGNFDLIRRDDGVDITIANLTPTTLSLTFNITSVRGTANGAQGITGAFTFNLSKTN